MENFDYLFLSILENLVFRIRLSEVILNWKGKSLASRILTIAFWNLEY